MQKLNELEATVRVGKNGLTLSVINEIKKQLKKRKVIKIKFL
ncbi:MAG: YhbY family RNA-binding protein, partial [Thermoplasmata archaeon]